MEKKGRYFAEVGGLAGLPDQSMTLIFEKYFEFNTDLWQGIVVEATPMNFARLYSNRPCLYRAEVAAGPEWTQLDFVGWGGCCSGIEKEMTEARSIITYYAS
jgi:hypothetical protein